MYTSLKLSKLLSENGCGLESESTWQQYRRSKKPDLRIWTYGMMWSNQWNDIAPAYDILNDLCCRYAVEVFGFEHWKRDYYHEIPNLQEWRTKPQHVLELLQQGKQDEAEAYLWKHCLYNPKNK